MTRRAGSADLPLHGGHVPRWLADRMTRLGAVMSEAIVHAYGRDELLRRLAHPFWFQSFGAVMGMDWHSSGITTSVIGALKRGLAPLAGELGIHVCGGRGKHSRATPGELIAIGQRVGFDGAALAAASRLVAKVDSAAVQDGFDLYLHGFIVTDDGRWVVVQQGMNGERKQARRYHWLSEDLKSFVDAPHAAIEGPGQGRIVNLADHRAEVSRRAQIELLHALGPDAIAREFGKIEAKRVDAGVAAPFGQLPLQGEQSDANLQLELLPHLMLPDHHEVRGSDIVTRRLHGNLAAAAECGPRDFTELLQVPGVGARTVRALAMVAEVLHGAPCRFTDPARFSLAHGGKDRHPFPVPTRVYDETIRVLKTAVGNAKLGQEEQLAAIRRLDDQARRLERHASGPSVEALISEELRQSHAYGGRSVFGGSRRLCLPRRPMLEPARRDDRGTRTMDGYCFVYVFPCAWEDHCKIGFSRDPLSRIQALHYRWFEFFDLDRAVLVETETVRDARDLELELRRPLVLHNAPAPLTVRKEAAGHTEWFRGASSQLEQAICLLEQRGHAVHAPMRAWLRSALLARSDRLYAWTQAQLSVDELDGSAGPTPTQRIVRDTLDAYAALRIELEPLLAPEVIRWYHRSTLSDFDNAHSLG